MAAAFDDGKLPGVVHQHQRKGVLEQRVSAGG